MKYKVSIPSPKAKRMVDQDRELKILLDNGGLSAQNIYVLSPNQQDFVFEIPEGYEHHKSITKMDGLIFYVSVTFFNKNKSRKETVVLTPEKEIV